MNRFFRFITFVLSFTLLYSCTGFKGTNEGTIIYEITYDEAQKAERSVITVLPTKMTQSFKNGSSKSLIKPLFSMFAYISDTTTKTNYILFQLMQDQYFCKSSFNEKTIGFDEFPGLTLTPTNETKVIAGKKAKKVIAKYNNSDEFEIYYTDEIAINNPNWYNPFSEIKGVLLDYQVELAGIRMHITAKEIKEEPIDDNEFKVSSDFEQIDCVELRDKVYGILLDQ